MQQLTFWLDEPGPSAPLPAGIAGSRPERRRWPEAPSRAAAAPRPAGSARARHAECCLQVLPPAQRAAGTRSRGPTRHGRPDEGVGASRPIAIQVVLAEPSPGRTRRLQFERPCTHSGCRSRSSFGVVVQGVDAGSPSCPSIRRPLGPRRIAPTSEKADLTGYDAAAAGRRWHRSTGRIGGGLRRARHA